MTQQEYTTARYQIDEYQRAASKYMSENKTNSIPMRVYVNFPFYGVVTNELRSEVETYEFINNPPTKYTLYINQEKKEATTWIGQKLGIVFFGKEYSSGFGDFRQSVWITGINGKKYQGTYYKSAGDYAYVKLLKS